jgi:S-adenosylmethionine hydrolase
MLYLRQFGLAEKESVSRTHVILTLSARGLNLTIITLLTDFGLQDGYPGIMKGVIWGIAPEVQIADLTHLISPQNILAGALALSRAAPYFTPGTIHLAVVDPGVGTQRRPLAAQIGASFFVGPDNGLCTALLEQAGAKGQPVLAVHLDQPRFWLPEVSNVFHGRDIFAPVAAHLANGVLLTDLGSPISDPPRLDLPRPRRAGAGWVGQVIIVDNFGNLSTNLERKHLEGLGEVRLRAGGRELHGIVNTFGDRPPGELVALYGEVGDLTISIVNGSAAGELHCGVGDPIEVLPG